VTTSNEQDGFAKAMEEYILSDRRKIVERAS
jgi:hypothetical protein